MKAIQKAHSILQRGLVSPEDYPVIKEAALLLLAQKKPLTYDDHQVIRFARAALLEEEEPVEPTPFDDNIARLLSEVEGAKAEFDSADSTMWSAAEVWANLAHQDAFTGHGVTMCRLLKLGDPGVKEEDDTIALVKRMNKKNPPDLDAVKAADDEIKECVEYRAECHERLQLLMGQLNNARAARSRWRFS